MIKIELTEEIISLLGHIKTEQTENGVKIEKNDLFYISDVLHTAMMVWGEYDNHIKDTEKSFDGRMWDKKLEDKAWNTYDYITENLGEIISIVLTNVKNEIKPGIYKRKEKEPGLWMYETFPEQLQ
jgi:hypothetical protein